LRSTGQHAPDEEGIHLMSHPTSAGVGTGPVTPVISVRPVTVTIPDRGQDLQVRVCAPTTGHDLPVVVLSHGMTLSMDDYAPLAGFWAARGFARGPGRGQRPGRKNRLEVTRRAGRTDTGAASCRRR
jgi:hypothetical protein